jgi:hypothetical protein
VGGIQDYDILEFLMHRAATAVHYELKEGKK